MSKQEKYVLLINTKPRFYLEFHMLIHVSDVMPITDVLPTDLNANVTGPVETLACCTACRRFSIGVQ